MKKTLVLFLALFLGLSTYQVGASTSEPLFKYKKLADETMGYDKTDPVMYYNGSTEQIEIPVAYNQEQTQFKSSWIGTIFNLHFPQISDETAFKEMYESRLDDFESWNMNAMIFQVRPLLDAFYPSAINPTSEFLSGKQGQDVDFDPLAYMVDATHERGMEYHAWFNPYRVTNSDIMSAGVLAKLSTVGYSKEDVAAMNTGERVAALNKAGVLADTNFAVKNPGYVLEFQGKLFLNPGEPDVINHVGDTIHEVVTNYDVDAIHFDDYFYPYKGAVLKDENGVDIPNSEIFGSKNEDRATFEKYGKGYEDSPAGIESWRRDNVTKLIDKVNDVIGTHNNKTESSVQFGISPFGIWEHKSIDDRGSNTPQGSSKSYSQTIFADTYQWIKDGKLDYVAPQIYWAFGAGAAPYGELARWWDQAVEGTQTKLYIGHANYKHVNNSWDSDWKNPEEINNQMKFNQTLSNIAGSALYGYSDIMPSDLDTVDPAKRGAHAIKNESLEILRNDSFAKVSLSPSHPQLSHGNVVPLDGIELKDNTLLWTETNNTNARMYVVYGGDKGQSVDDIMQTGTILGKVNFAGKQDYVFNVSDAPFDTYVVSVVDKAYVQTDGKTAETFVFDATLQNLALEIKKDTTLTKQQFLDLLQIQANDTYQVATNFDEVFDASKLGTVQISVTLTSDRTGASVPFSVSLNVVKADTNPEVKPEPEPKPETKPDKDNNESPTTLPATGVQENYLGYSILVAGFVLVIFGKRHRNKAK